MKQIKSEFELIDWIRQQQENLPGHVDTGIGDDMAILKLGSENVLVTTDLLLEGVHFDSSSASLEQIGRKAMCCSLSDCAAMASKPIGAVVSVSLPNDFSMEQAQQLHAGLQSAGDEFQCPIIGGDTTSWDKDLTINVTMLSTTPNPIKRTGAVSGDAILVTGELGGSLKGKHLDFTPRLKEAHLLKDHVNLHAMIDVSDGLLADLKHICDENNLVAIIDEVAIPLSNAARQSEDPIKSAMNDGEDFELLFCISPADGDKLMVDWKEISKTRLNNIGHLTTPDSELIDGSSQLYLRKIDGSLSPLEVKGWEHFKA